MISEKNNVAQSPGKIRKMFPVYERPGNQFWSSLMNKRIIESPIQAIKFAIINVLLFLCGFKECLATLVFCHEQSKNSNRICVKKLAAVLAIVIMSLSTITADAQNNANPVQPLTVDDETTTVPGSRQLVNGSGTTVTTSTPGQISISVNSTNFPLVNQCRLYGVSGSPYSDTGSGGTTTLYFGPCPDKGDSIFLYSSGAWSLVHCPELNLSVTSLSSNTMYDIYVYNNSGTVVIDTPVAWANETTPPTRSIQDGVYVKNGNPTRLYVGSIEVLSGTVYSWSGNRGIWNAYNRITGVISAIDSTSSWGYSSAAWRIADNKASTNYGIAVARVVTGAQIDIISMTRYAKGPGAAYTSASLFGIGVDSTTPVVAGELFCTSYTNGGIVNSSVPYATSQLGAHSYENLEYASGAVNFYGGIYGGLTGSANW